MVDSGLQSLSQGLQSPRQKPDIGYLLREQEHGEIVRLLGCSQNQKSDAKELVDRIVTRALHPEFHPEQVYESGSFKRGSAIFYNFDVDLVLKLHNFNHSNMKDYLKRSRRALLVQFGSDLTFCRESSHRCLKFEVAPSFEFDLLITGDPSVSLHSTPRDYFSPAGSEEADKELIAAKGKYPMLQAFVLLCKHWKNEYTGGDFFLKSYYIELLCYRILKEEVGAHTKLKEAFWHFLMAFVNGQLEVANPNPYSPSTLSPYPDAVKSFQTYARSTLDQYYPQQQYYRAGVQAYGSVCGQASSHMQGGVNGAECVDKPRHSSVGNENRDSQATSEWAVEWQGECRYVARGKYTRMRNGEDCVIKWFKSGQVFEETYWAQDLKVVEKAAEIIEAFNLCGFCGDSIRINRPGVWRKQSDGQKVLVEPFLTNFAKFNSNSGYVNHRQGAIMQTLSHFSYHYSHGKMLLCDLQGSQQGGAYVLTDPVVLSTHRGFGPNDLGEELIENFFYHHDCNQYCSPSWRKAKAVDRYEPQEGSAFSVQALRRRTPSRAGQQEVNHHHGQQSSERSRSDFNRQQEEANMKAFLAFVFVLLAFVFLACASADGRRY